MIPYSDQQIAQQFQNIRKDFPNQIELVKWQPKDQAGNIVYGQPASIYHYFESHTQDIDFTLFIDLDQFIFSPKNIDLRQFAINNVVEKGITYFYFGQKKFADRFCSPGKKVIDIVDSYNMYTSGWAGKIMIAHDAFNKYGEIRSIHGLPYSKGTYIGVPEEDIHFNHYNTNLRLCQWALGVGKMNSATVSQYDDGMKRYQNQINQKCKDNCSDKGTLKVIYPSHDQLQKLCNCPTLTIVK